MPLSLEGGDDDERHETLSSGAKKFPYVQYHDGWMGSKLVTIICIRLV